MAGNITAFEPQKRAKGRINVYLDGVFAFGLAELVAARLRVGMWLSDAEIAALQLADEAARAHERALHYLSYRPRSEAELRRYLLEHDFSETAVADVLQRLSRAGLVDDAAFARYWVENRTQFRPKGRRVLVQELRQKGIASQVIEQALADYDEPAAAAQVAAAQARRLAHLPPDLFHRRLWARLARRGFASDTIQEVLATPPFSDAHTEESEESLI